MAICIHELNENDLTMGFFDDFQRYQSVDKVVRGPQGSKTIEYEKFIDDWNTEERAIIIRDLKKVIQNGGAVFGAYEKESLIGFAAIDNTKLGENGDYTQLKENHVDKWYRRKGIGETLFEKCKEWARVNGYKKIYISSHSAIETVSFYKSLGCKDAEWIFEEQVKKEPCDYQMEYHLEGEI